jgi:hypothetical protein
MIAVIIKLRQLNPNLFLDITSGGAGIVYNEWCARLTTEGVPDGTRRFTFAG